ncbi:MAG: 16S rRNA (guanine(966)-N(2))-methyltransferase RsmD [Rhodanobacteraceae bacterium]
MAERQVTVPKHHRNAAFPGRLHIIGGSLRGSRLAVPVLPGLRPTPQRLRQTLFDWLAPVIAGANVLDAFAGSGALGIEALSRGARAATFFERDSAQAAAIEADLARLHQDGGKVRCVDALQALAVPASERFDIALLDPPFDLALWEPAAALLDAHGWLAPHALVYVEAGDADGWNAPPGWQVNRQREAGAVRGTLFRV